MLDKEVCQFLWVFSLRSNSIVTFPTNKDDPVVWWVKTYSTHAGGPGLIPSASRDKKLVDAPHY